MTSPLGSLGGSGATTRLPFVCFCLEIRIKTIAYVDGFNLYYRLKHSPFKWLNVGKLLVSILEKNHEIVKIKYFTSLAKWSENDPTRPERQMAYWRALKESNAHLEIIRGTFKTKKVWGKFLEPIGRGIVGGELVRSEIFVEKNSDVNIASHIVFDSFDRNIECVVLLSNDSDLVMPLHMARKKLGKLVIIVSPHETQGSLRKVARASRNITDDMLRKCQLPDKVGSITKPVEWVV